MFVWLFHRISGIVLLGLLSAQLLTGFYQASSSNSETVKTIASLHRHAPLVCVLVFCAVFHALYGVRTMILDLGVKRERLLFWSCTGLGSLLYVAFLVSYFTYAAT